MRYLPLLLLISPVLLAQPRGDLLLKNAQLVDPQAQTVRAGHVLIQGDKIAQIWLSKLPKAVTATEIVDLHNHYLLPGLFDLHVHAWGDPAPTGEDEDDMEMGPPMSAQHMQNVGVTGFLDLGTAPEVIFGLRERVRTRVQPGADVFAAGPVWVQIPPEKATEMGGFHAGAFVTGPQDVPQKIHDFIQKWRPDVVKVIYDHSGTRPGMDIPTLVAIVQAAHKQKTKVVAHIQLWQDIRDAVGAHVDAVTHLDDDGDIPDDVTQVLAKTHTCIIPTLGVQMGLTDIVDKPEVQADPLLRALVEPKLLETYRHPEQFGRKGTFWLGWQRGSRASYLRSLRRLYDAGICTLPGADTGNIGVFQGWSLHRELELYGEAGVPAWKVLRSATVEAAQFVGSDAGRLQAGARANLLVVKDNPVKHLAATRTVDLVVQGGRIVKNHVEARAPPPR